jgi:hypothetical protein
MNTLVEFPVQYTKEDYIEYVKDSCDFSGEKFDESEITDEGFYAWNSGQEEVDYEWFLEEVQNQLNKTKIKDGFLEIENGGWQRQHGMTLPFEITAETLWHKISSDNDVTVKVFKEGQKLKFMRYSHDEPTGACITLHSTKNYEKVKKVVWK